MRFGAYLKEVMDEKMTGIALASDVENILYRDAFNFALIFRRFSC